MGISNNYWCNYWDNIRWKAGIIVLVYNGGKGWQYKVAFQLRGNSGYFGKLKYMKDFSEKPSIYALIGIEDYVLLKRYTPIRVYSEYQLLEQWKNVQLK